MEDDVPLMLTQAQRRPRFPPPNPTDAVTMPPASNSYLRADVSRHD